MKIIHVVKTLPRLMNDALAARLSVMPAEVLAGARPPGNNTLDQEHVSGERRYRSLADFDVRDAARRDLQDLASICALPDFRRLMQAACLRLVQFLNQTGLGRDVGLPQPTVHRWLNRLETSYLLVRLPAYAVNRTKRLVKSPRTFWGDTGAALYLENLVLHDLSAWCDARVDRV